MSETSSDVKSLENGGGLEKTMRGNIFDRSRSTNPWPVPPVKQAGGAFGSTGGSSDQTKKFGGGFGSGTFEGFGGSAGRRGAADSPKSFDDYGKGFGQRKEPSGMYGGAGFGTTSSSRLAATESLIPNKSVASSLTENVFGGPRRDSSEVMSPTKRSRTGRRSGRRGRGGPGHCFHCQEHGHISRLCPKKTTEAEDFEGGGGGEENRFVEEETVNGQKRTVPLMDVGRGSSMNSNRAEDLTKEASSFVPTLAQCMRKYGSSYQEAKLENLKLRESYYGGYGYGKTAAAPATNSMEMKSRTGIEKKSEVRVGLSAGGGFGGPPITPRETTDKFSEQLDNALKLHVVEPPIPSSPRGLTQFGKSDGTGSRMNSKPEVMQLKLSNPPPPARKEDPKEVSSETLTIETRRIVRREGECHFEETTVINFPSVLPPNVRVITAQFVPVATPQ